MKTKKNTQHLFIVFSNLDLGGIQRKMIDISNYINGNKKYNNITLHLIVREEGDFSFKGFLNKDSSQTLIHISNVKKKKLLSNIFFLSIFSNKFNNYFFYLYILFLTIKYRPSTILGFFHFTLPCLAFIKIASFSKIKIAIGQDNLQSFYNSSEHINSVFSPSLIQKLYNFSDLIITQTNYSKNDLINNFNINPKIISVIPNWVVDTTYKKIPDNKKIHDIIYCGRFAKQKNLTTLIQIFAKVNARLPDTKLCLIGAGKEETNIKNEIKKHNLVYKVAILPPSYDVKNELQKSRIFVLTSQFEGHPMVLLEAMALGIVPVVLKYPAVDEYLQNNKNGFIENNSSEMVNKIISVLQDKKLQNKISLNARKTAKNQYGNSLIDETIQLLINN